MANQRSVEMLAFNFPSRTFAYKKLAQGLSRSTSAFSKLHAWVLGPSRQSWPMCPISGRHWNRSQKCYGLHPEHSGSLQVHSSSCIAAENWEKLLWSQKSWIPGRTISPEGMSPQARKIQSFLDKLRFPKSKKTLQRCLRFVNYYRNYIPRMAEKLNPFYKVPKTEVPINITSQLKETFDSVNNALIHACQLALKQPVPGK